MTTSREDREELFALLADPSSMARFFDRVADDVDWTVQGTHPIAGRYTDKRRLLAEAIGRLNPLTAGGVRLEVGGLAVDGDTVVAEFRSSATGLDGGSYDNALCWVCRFDSAEPGAVVVEVREYLDSAMISWMIDHNQRLAPA
jgi:uncharacterized protein